METVPENFNYDSLDCFKKLPKLPDCCEEVLFGAGRANPPVSFNPDLNIIFDKTV